MPRISNRSQVIPEKGNCRKEGRKGKKEQKKEGKGKNQYLSEPSNVQKLDLMTLALDQKKSLHLVPKCEPQRLKKRKTKKVKVNN